MQTSQGSMFESLRAVRSFLDEHADKLGTVVQTGARARLDAAIATLDDHASTQTGSALQSQGLTQKQRSLRVTLVRDHMSAIAKIGRADLPNTPEFRPLRMPRGHMTPEKLAAAATGMATVAEKHADVFTAAGLPTEFLTQLRDAAVAMLETLSDRAVTRGRRTGATTGLKAKLSEGRKVVAILDAFVKTALAKDPSLLANWNLVKRVSKAGTKSAIPAPVPSTPAAPPANAGVPAPLTSTSTPTPTSTT